MTIVEGQIEPLKKLKEILNNNGITRFNSISEINEFLKNYEIEKNGLPGKIEHEVELELKALESDYVNLRRSCNDLAAEASKIITDNINELQVKLDSIRQNKNAVNRIILFPYTSILRFKKSFVEKNIQKKLSSIKPE